MDQLSCGGVSSTDRGSAENTTSGKLRLNQATEIYECWESPSMNTKLTPQSYTCAPRDPGQDSVLFQTPALDTFCSDR